MSPDINENRGRDARRSGVAFRGVIALMTVIILGAILLVVGISAALVGQTDTILAGQADRGHYARVLATSCAEEALHRLKLDSAYSGGMVSVGGNDCSAVVSGSGPSRTVIGSATYEGHTRTVTVTATLRQNAAASAAAWNIDSWQEINP